MAAELVYVLPKYDPDSPEHFYHLYDFLRSLNDQIGLLVVIEQVPRPELLANRMQVVCLHTKWPAVRLWEELFIFLRARLRGTRKFYVHYSYTGTIAAALIVRILGGECFYWNCGLYKDFAPGRGSSLRERLHHARQLWLLERSLHLCTWLVTGSPRMAEYYSRAAKLPPKKIRLLPNLVDARRFQSIGREEARQHLGLQASQPVFLFLHRVALRKGAGYLPELAEQLSDHLESFTLLVAGDGPYLPELRRHVQARRLTRYFDFRGWVPNRDVPAFYRAADIYLMPSQEEGVPHVLLEAMAAGCPFVAFDVGGIRDLLSPEQLPSILPVGDLVQMASQSLRMLVDLRWRQGLIQSGYRCVKAFSQEEVSRTFIDLIRGHPHSWSEIQGLEGSTPS